MLKITVAGKAGFCFGVKRAVGMAYKESEDNENRTYTLGPIIHNEFVVNDLSEKGIKVLNEDLYCDSEKDYAPPGSTIIIRSHGITRSLYQTLEEKNYKVIDATCPFVKKIHHIVESESLSGKPVVIIGNPNHPEVKGIMGWVSGPCCVVEKKEEAAAIHLPLEKEICVISQTTFNFHKFQELVEIIRSLGYHVNVTNTICNATKERQEEAENLARRSDVMFVIGGKSSSNSRKLYEICKARCPETYFVQSPEDLKSVRIKTDSCVGITAGASTPNTIIQEVSLDVRRTEF